MSPAARVLALVLAQALLCGAGPGPLRAGEARQLHFTLPAQDAWSDSLPGRCEASPTPVGSLCAVQLWRLASPMLLEQEHNAGVPGSPDSFDVDPGEEMLSYYVTVTKASGKRSCPSNLITLNGRVGVGLPGDSGPGPWLGTPRPNPAAGLVALPFSLPAPAPVRLEIHDLQGRIMAIPEDGERGAGVHLVLWDARLQAQGLYFVQARIGPWRGVRRLLVLR